MEFALKETMSSLLDGAVLTMVRCQLISCKSQSQSSAIKCVWISGEPSHQECSAHSLKTGEIRAMETPAALLFVTECKSAWLASVQTFVVTVPDQLSIFASKILKFAVSLHNMFKSKM